MNELSLNEYQNKALSTAVYPNVGTGTLEALMYCALGLCGEAGEIAEKIKKIYRDSKGEITEEARLALIKELGDPLWYIGAMGKELNISLQEIAQTNLDKLRSRKERGVIGGSGDNR